MLIRLLGIAAGRGAGLAGTEDGPFELRERGLNSRLLRMKHTVEDLGNIPGVYEARFPAPHGENVNNLRNVLQVNRHTHACVLGTRAQADNAFLLIVGGDHSLAIGTLAGLSDSCKRLGLLWIDAHADFNTPRTTPSGNAHGMSLAVACGRGHRALRMIADRDPMIDEGDVYLLGCRDLDRGERTLLERSRINLIPPAQWRQQGVVETVVAACRDLSGRCDHVHLSFDIDVLDPAHVPGTGTPVPSGLSVDEMRAVLAELARRRCLASAEFVELNPRLDPEGRTAELTLDLILTLLSA